MKIKETPAAPAPNALRMIERWEYKSQRMDYDANLAQYGSEGWELVAVVPIPFDPSMAMFHFKRRRS